MGSRGSLRLGDPRVGSLESLKIGGPGVGSLESLRLGARPWGGESGVSQVRS